jgi:hypothetical protein
MGSRTIQSIRVGLLILLAASALMVGVRVASYPPVLQQPGGLLLVLEPVGALLVYAFFILWATRTPTPEHERALLIGTLFGAISGVISISHIVRENYGTMSPRVTVLVTLAAILAMFLPWAFAGFQAVRKTGRVRLGVFAAVFGAVVCMVLTVSFGFGELLTSLPRLAQRDAASPDFLRSGWTDLRAFVIADVFDAGFWHMVIGPAVATVLGGITSALASVRRGNHSG